MTISRYLLIPPGKEGVYHVRSRCIRRAFLLGWDPYSEKNYDHRKDWVYNRLRFLVTCFGIEVCGFSIMINHTHLILRTLPQKAQAWSNKEVAFRWLTLYPRRRDLQGNAQPPTDSEIDILLDDPDLIETYRGRLTSISWFMKSLNEWISRKANKEDNCTGKFWEGRFKSTALLDQAAILTCLQYVDLNPIRAGVAETPEDSAYTSAHDRIQARQARVTLEKYRSEKEKGHEAKNQTETQLLTLEDLDQQTRKDQWLSPMGRSPEVQNGLFLNIDLKEYIELLDWTGRQMKNDKKGSIPSELAPILRRLEIETEPWLECISHFGNRFYHVAGSVKRILEATKEIGKKWLRGKTEAKKVFG